MAVRNAYVLDTEIPTQVKGGKVIAIVGAFETLAADDAGSKYRICRLPANAVPIQIEINSDSIAGFTEVDLGIYDTLEQGGAVKDIDAFQDGVDMNGGYAIGSELNGLSAIAIANLGKQIYELAGDSAPTPNGEYDLVLTCVSEVSAAGTVAFRILLAVSS